MLMSNTSSGTFRVLRDRAVDILGSRLEAELLLVHAFGHSRAWLFAHLDDQTQDGSNATHFDELVAQRRSGQPVAYLLGQREFYGRDYIVNNQVLIPRPETELLVDLALALPLADDCSMVDIGTGSGCIALSLAAERPDWQVTATELSAVALAVADSNRKQLALERVALLQGDLFEPLSGQQFDLVVSNPPYIAAGDPHLEQGDLRFEPSEALSSGNDGLDIIGKLIRKGRRHINPNGWLLIEHGYDQGATVATMMGRAGYTEVATHRDLAGIDRATLGRFPTGTKALSSRAGPVG
jgi:release factor glutamine methyltransferase